MDLNLWASIFILINLTSNGGMRIHYILTSISTEKVKKVKLLFGILRMEAQKAMPMEGGI